MSEEHSNNTDKGILYIAFGKSYREEAIQSAIRISELGDWQICIITDDTSEKLEAVFDDVILESDSSAYEPHRFGGKIKPVYLRETPYLQTLYLDTDTYVADKSTIDELFELIPQYDLAGAFDTHRRIEWQYRDQQVPDINVPNSFPWLNTGVIVYEKNSKTNDMFREWELLYEEQQNVIDGIADQAPFIEALYHSEVKHTVLPNEYNHRTPFQQTLRGKVRIIHGHHSNKKEIAEAINNKIPSDISKIPSANPLFHSFHHYDYMNSKDEKIAVPTELKRTYWSMLLFRFYQTKDSIQSNGILETLNLGLRKVIDSIR